MECRKFQDILGRGEEGKGLSRSEILFLVGRSDPEQKRTLFDIADRVRKKHVGDSIHVRGIIEFSNYCRQNCLYCGLRKDNQELKRYRMGPEEIIATAKMAKQQGFGTIVLQSGEDPWFTCERMAEIIKTIKEETDMAITLSLGERDFKDYLAWKNAGADRYLLKHETASPKLFGRLKPGRKLHDRLKALVELRSCEYEVGSGNMVGLPGQSDGDLTDDIWLFRAYDFDMIGIGPFIAHPHTPLKGESSGSVEKTLIVIALTRILTKNTNIPATTATGVLEEEGQQKALLAGANVLMLNITPASYRKYYEIYPGKEHFSLGRKDLPNFFSSIGREMGKGKGPRRYSQRI